MKFMAFMHGPTARVSHHGRTSRRGRKPWCWRLLSPCELCLCGWLRLFPVPSCSSPLSLGALGYLVVGAGKVFGCLSVLEMFVS